LLPLEPRVRLGFAGVAVAVIVGLLVARLRAMTARRNTARGVYDRVERIRRDREERRRGGRSRLQ
jgi:hypothetical protein